MTLRILRLGVMLVITASAGATPVPMVSNTSDGVAVDLPFRREVLIPAVTGPNTWVQVAADSLLASRCAREFSDVRLIDEVGTVVPLLVMAPRRWDNVHRVESRHAIRWEDDKGTPVATVDLGPPGSVRRFVDLPAALRSFTHVAMQTRVPGQDWRRFVPLRQAVPGYSLKAVVNLLRLPESVQFLRLLHIAAEPPPSAADSLAVVVLRSRDVAPRQIAFEAFPVRIGDNKVVLACHVSEPDAHLSGLTLSHVLGDFATRVAVEVRGDRRDWQRVSITPSRAQAGLQFSPIAARELRLEVSGIDPPEIPFVITELLVHDTRFAFPHPGPGRYWLLYGDQWRPSRAGPAEAEFLAATSLVTAALGSEQSNPTYEEPGVGLRWLQRRPGVVTVVMLLLLAIVVWVAVTPSRRRDEPPEGSA